MSRRAFWIVLLLLGAYVEGRAVVAEAQGSSLKIDSIEVQIVRTPQPPQVLIRVHGLLLDGCTSLGAVSQRREANVVTLTIATKHSGAQVCTSMAKILDETIRLEGAFPRGEYVVRVNGVARRFSI